MRGATVAGGQEWSREAQLVAVRFPAEVADELVAGALGTLEVPALLAAGGLRSERPAVAAADLDDEAETEEERQAVAEARADRERGIQPVALEDVLAEFAGE